MSVVSHDPILRIKPFPQISHRGVIPARFAEIYGRLINNEFSFRLLNRDFIRDLNRHEAPPLSAAGARVADEMRQHGFAVADFTDFFDASLLDQLTGFFAERKAELDAARRKTNKPLKNKEVYLDTVHKAHTFRANDPVSDFLAAPAFASISAAYMGMTPRFVGSSFWHTRQMPTSSRGYSQLWHRDYNDRRLMKVFLYLNDVSEQNGYFEYLTDSAATLPLGRMFDRIGPDGLRAYPDREAVDAFVEGKPTVYLHDVPKERWSGSNSAWSSGPTCVRCTAPAGSLIFADTFGLHRGGFVEKGHRDMIMLTYSTNFNVHSPHFAVTAEFANALSPFMKMAFGVV